MITSFSNMFSGTLNIYEKSNNNKILVLGYKMNHGPGVAHTTPQGCQPLWLSTLDFMLDLLYCGRDVTISGSKQIFCKNGQSAETQQIFKIVLLDFDQYDTMGTDLFDKQSCFLKIWTILW